MDSRVKYLDELFLALKTSREANKTESIDNSSQGEFPPRYRRGEAVKASKVAKTLIRNLREPGIRSGAFEKSIQVLDLLYRAQPYLLQCDEPSDENNIGIEWAINRALEISLIHWNNKAYLWLLHRKVAEWCAFTVGYYGSRWKLRLTNYLLDNLADVQSTITGVLSGNSTFNEFVTAVQKALIICEFCHTREMQKSLLLIDVEVDTNKWDLIYERFVRITLYVHDSLYFEFETAVDLRLRLVESIVSYVMFRATKYRIYGRHLTMGSHLTFAIEVLRSFLFNEYKINDKQDRDFAKSLLRLYLLSMTNDAGRQCFNNQLPFRDWNGLDIMAKWIPSAGGATHKALQLIHFDLKRRKCSSLGLKREFGVILLKEKGFSEIQRDILLPYGQSRQLENMRKKILRSFDLPEACIFQKDLKELGIMLDRFTDSETLFSEIDKRLELLSKTYTRREAIIALRLVGRLACFESMSICKSKGYDICRLCDALSAEAPLKSLSLSRPVVSERVLSFELLRRHFLMPAIIQNLEASTLSALVMTLRKVFTHFRPPRLSLEQNMVIDASHSFEVLQKACSSHNRTPRVFAVILLSLWNTTEEENGDDHQTSVLIQFIQLISVPQFTETNLMSWAQLTLTTQGEGFDALLLKLTDIFNSSNFAERSVMAHELKYLSHLQAKTTYQLLSPILPVLLRQLSKHLSDRKLNLERLAQFVDYPVKTILENFQRYIIPYAITHYKDDVMTEVAKILSNNESDSIPKQKERLLDKNSRQIFAVALVKHGLFSLDTIETLFLNCVPTFDKGYVAGYLPDYKTLAEILKLFKNSIQSSPTAKENEKMVLNALRFLLTNFASDKKGPSKYKSGTNWSDEQESFFQQKLQENILGIFQVFSSDMHDVEGRTTHYEKIRVINGIFFLIKHACSNCIISALAQISICLQTAQEVREIMCHALRCWLFLIKKLSEEQLLTVIDSFFSFCLQRWGSFDFKSKILAKEILTSLIAEKGSLIFVSRPYITSALVNKSELNILEDNKQFARMVNKVLSNTNWYAEYSSNLKSCNKYVIKQTLTDVKIFLERTASDELNEVGKAGNSLGISQLLGSLMNTAHKFRVSDYFICECAAECIALIGALDVTKYVLPRETVYMEEVFDLNNYAQVVKFLMRIMDKILVPAFWESENPTKQLFVALVMQESLKFCGLSSVSWDVSKPELYPNENKLWSRFNDVSKTTLYPLMSSLYLAQSWKEYVPLQYPSFNPREAYHVWIRNLTLDLLKLGTAEDHPLHVFSSLIREDEGLFSENILPYVVMDILSMTGDRLPSDALIKNLQIEFRHIFDYDIQNLNHFQFDCIKMCYGTIFRVFEYCKKWVTQFKHNHNRLNGTYIIKEPKHLKILARIDDFLSIIPYGRLAQRSLQTDSFERSALYMELSYRSKDEGFFDSDELLLNLKTCYAEIGDIDAVEGVLTTFSSGSIEAKIEELQYSNNWKMAQECYEALGQYSQVLLQPEEKTLTANTKLLKSMFRHQQYDQILERLNLLLPKPSNALPSLDDGWYSMGLESAYLSGKYSELRKWLKKVETLKSIHDPILLMHYHFGRAFSLIEERNREGALKAIKDCFRIVGAHFSNTSGHTTLLKRRETLSRLHALYDFSFMSTSEGSYDLKDDGSRLNRRLLRIGPDFEPRFYLLSARKAYQLMTIKKNDASDLADTYFRIARLSRKNSRLDLACESLMHALQLHHPSAELEYAEVLWKKGENDKAVKLVSDLQQRYQNDHSVSSRERAKILLKFTIWLDLSNNSISEQIIRQYNEVIAIDPKWDEPCYSMGLYFSRLLEKKNAEGYVTSGRFESRSVCYFLRAFEKNTFKVRETLPKVVTFWLDTASLYASESSNSRKAVLKKSTEDICRSIESAIKNCPIFIWYGVLTQLLSRLLHPHRPTVQLIVKILLNLSLEYTTHMLWYISALKNSSSDSRAAIGAQILEQFAKSAHDGPTLSTVSDELVKQLTNVCVKDAKTSTSRSGRSLEKDFDFPLSIAPCALVVPANINLEIVAPISATSMAKYNPFRPQITISKFGESYKVFSSLKKPKKLNVTGSDGKLYEIMCKKEDVRQDNQYMQFATTMHFLLKKDFESRKRNLSITTYAVLSLREDCGLIEIVPDVVTLRSVLAAKYESLKIKFSLKSMHEKWQTLVEGEKLEFFLGLTKTFPPVLYQWFLETFPDPVAWCQGRNIFARSYAVMGMVGHILGLGDRHCENILLNVNSGKVLHVDFDCLFEKGKRLPIPEIVPFRLTQNLLDALGITGTEGTFKRSSQVTLELMRGNELALVNIIETIMYDRNMDHSIQKALKVIRNKIRGIDSRDGLILSVPGQVETVIQESTSAENLSKMYIGWLPFW
ncbi:LAMI_0D09626g1_1 [Lachancea mirantina]|uniref:Serine/threonine-protein kinase MEC1 n=1 Tax=Lachancea mirantina TaxID=1230905 RepID=A0A1G4JDP3_9SACH|nr:LAMI_0D09626g1_1 [Lachancea mirantina]